MSLTSKRIEELRAYAADRKGELAKLINDAADTIELLSIKLRASQMERSSQYYHGGWIPCSERLPEEGQEVLIQMVNGYMATIMYSKSGAHDHIVAWMPLPDPWRGEKDEL